MNRPRVLPFALFFCFFCVAAHADFKQTPVRSTRASALTLVGAPSPQILGEEAKVKHEPLTASAWQQAVLPITAVADWIEAMTHHLEQEIESFNRRLDAAGKNAVVRLRSGFKAIGDVGLNRRSENGLADQQESWLLAETLPETQYWDYYADCDRWGVQLVRTVQPPALLTTVPSAKDLGCGLREFIHEVCDWFEAAHGQSLAFFHGP
jgi:hypothetical protein